MLHIKPGYKMKANEIINALGLSKTKQRSAHASQLAEIYKHLQSIKQDVLSVDVTSKEFAYSQRCDLVYQGWNEPRKWEIVDKGDIMPGERWTIKTKTGAYTVSLPTVNAVYYAFAALFPAFISPVATVDSIAADRTLILDKQIVKEITKAMHFVKIDKLGTFVNCVCIRVKSGIAHIISTDRTILYKSLPLALDYPDGDLLLNAEDLKRAFLKDKTSLCIEVYNDRILLNGVTTVKQDFEAPNYDNVIPDYKKSVEVNRKQLYKAVSLISLSANKWTKQVNLHINGAIQVSAEDLDFSHESSTVVKYERKDTIDFDVSVNAKYLLSALKALDTDTVEIYSDGAKDKCIGVGNKSEVAKVLIMPIMTAN